MGATNFVARATRQDDEPVEDVFQRLRDQDQHKHGNGPYQGTIGQKNGYHPVDLPDALSVSDVVEMWHAVLRQGDHSHRTDVEPVDTDTGTVYTWNDTNDAVRANIEAYPDLAMFLSLADPCQGKRSPSCAAVWDDETVVFFGFAAE